MKNSRAYNHYQPVVPSRFQSASEFLSEIRVSKHILQNRTMTSQTHFESGIETIERETELPKTQTSEVTIIRCIVCNAIQHDITLKRSVTKQSMIQTNTTTQMQTNTTNRQTRTQHTDANEHNIQTQTNTTHRHKQTQQIDANKHNKQTETKTTHSYRQTQHTDTNRHNMYVLLLLLLLLLLLIIMIMIANITTIHIIIVIITNARGARRRRLSVWLMSHEIIFGAVRFFLRVYLVYIYIYNYVCVYIYIYIYTN